MLFCNILFINLVQKMKRKDGHLDRLTSVHKKAGKSSYFFSYGFTSLYYSIFTVKSKILLQSQLNRSLQYRNSPERRENN